MTVFLSNFEKILYLFTAIECDKTQTCFFSALVPGKVEIVGKD